MGIIDKSTTRHISTTRRDLAFAILLLLAMLVFLCLSSTAQAEELENSWRYTNGMPNSLTSGETSAGNSSGAGTLTPQSSSSDLLFGVDVSSWDYDIDWGAAKNAGVNFAIIRCGRGQSYNDAYWTTNVSGCQNNGISFGTYLYSFATDTDSAAAEAYHVLNQLSAAGLGPNDMALPIYLDMEDSSTADLSTDTYVTVFNTFRSVLNAAGYQNVGVYANCNWWRNYLCDIELDSTLRWIAHWDVSDPFLYYSDLEPKGFGIWQYGPATVNGISVEADGDYINANLLESYYSSVYDYDYYIANNPDVAAAYNGDRMQTLQHFLTCGMNEGRQAIDPSTFNVYRYRSYNPDVALAYGWTNLQGMYYHYISCGRYEGRTHAGANPAVGEGGFITSLSGTDYSPVYDYAYYTSNNADVAACYSDRWGYPDPSAVLSHFVGGGMNEGRQASADFVLSYYRSNYDDLRSAFGSDNKAYYIHYIECGQREGRIADRLLNTLSIYSSNETTQASTNTATPSPTAAATAIATPDNAASSTSAVSPTPTASGSSETSPTADAGISAASEKSISIVINGAGNMTVTNTSLEKAVAASGVAPAEITSLEIISGTLADTDIAYLTKTAQASSGEQAYIFSSLASLNIDEGVTLDGAYTDSAGVSHEDVQGLLSGMRLHVLPRLVKVMHGQTTFLAATPSVEATPKVS